MVNFARRVPLTRRLINWYLVFGLAGVLLALVTALSLAYRDSLVPLVAVVAIGPVLLLLAGTVVVYHTSRLNSLIERELRRMSSHDGASPQLLAGSDPVVQGWNTIVERLRSQEVISNLRDRLSVAVGDLRQERVVRAFAQVPLPIVVTEESANITLVNRAFESLARASDDSELIGRSLLEILKCDEAANAKEIAEKLGRQKGSVSFELQRGPSQQAGVLQVTRKPLSGDSSDSHRDIWVIRDITQQLLADEMRNQFVQTATHELRTPLANIKAYAETLIVEDRIDVERQKQFCNIINDEATRLARFVDELLNVSQIEAGSLKLQRRETDLLRLLDEVVQHVRPELESKKISLEVRLPPKLAKQRLDKDRFGAALMNLLGNAAKYTLAGGRVLLAVEAGSEQIVMQVEDSGIGIAEDELPRIFEKFFRSSDERISDIAGNGLGLAFTQEVVRLHGGKIDVQSELNKGTRFVITLPV